MCSVCVCVCVSVCEKKFSIPKAQDRTNLAAFVLTTQYFLSKYFGKHNFWDLISTNTCGSFPKNGEMAGW